MPKTKSKKDDSPPPPSRIVAFNNSDKSYDERWDDKRCGDLANFPCPSRIILLGPPNVGKSTMIKNIIIHARPRYDEVFLVHLDAGITKDYEDLEPTAEMAEIPDLDFWNSLPAEDEKTGKPIKRCVILDDMEYSGAHRERLKNLAVLLRYVSSHKYCSVFVAHQEAFSLPSIARKMGNVYIIWKPRSRTDATLIENRLGMKKGDLTLLFREAATGPKDSICVDFTSGSPAPLRLNLFEPLELSD